MAGKWPSDFLKILETDSGGCLPKDHVKVCLSHANLKSLAEFLQKNANARGIASKV